MPPPIKKWAAVFIIDELISSPLNIIAPKSIPAPIQGSALLAPRSPFPMLTSETAKCFASAHIPPKYSMILPDTWKVKVVESLIPRAALSLIGEATVGVFSGFDSVFVTEYPKSIVCSVVDTAVNIAISGAFAASFLAALLILRSCTNASVEGSDDGCGIAGVCAGSFFADADLEDDTPNSFVKGTAFFPFLSA